MKRINKILLATLILLIILAGAANFIHQGEQKSVGNIDKHATMIGNNSNGTVYRVTCGNELSNNTAVLILGVHNLEGGIHNATYDTIMNFTKENSLNKRYIVYFIKLNFKDSGMNTSNYDTNRHMGELLANKYVVPDIERYDSYIVVDVHEMESYWEYQEYVGVLDNKSSETMEYAYRLSDNLDYPILTINAGTSPKWVTVPISKNGHNTILFETPQKASQKNKTQVAIDMIRTIDNLNAY